ncbi:(2Fe-2S)-binding protein [Moorella stamsii]|uniref:(2Fe-2S)-binding protein n=1 Tax=Neomoorella stamsii TaxID=1266720 RepID=UPI0006D53A5F|nr:MULTISPECIES: (2Fe-2S)-binding protein [Moorella]
MSWVAIELEINGDKKQVIVEETELLVDVLREKLGLTGTKKACGEGECGACTVLLDGEPVNSCLVLAVQVDGRKITTIEGIGKPGQLHPIQEAFINEGAIQCGYCTPGMILSAKALLDNNPEPTEAEVRRALSGNLCRCTGYQKIVKAVLEAAKRLSLQAGKKAAGTG